MNVTISAKAVTSKVEGKVVAMYPAKAEMALAA